MKVVAVIVLVAVLFVFIAPVADLCPAARLVRAGHALQNLAAFLPLTIPRAAPLVDSQQFRGIGISTKESLPVVPIFTLDCVFLC
jgi:hypothetical protein